MSRRFAPRPSEESESEAKKKAPLPEPIVRPKEISECKDPKWLLLLKDAFAKAKVEPHDLQSVMISSFSDAGYDAKQWRDGRIALTLQAGDGSTQQFVGGRTDFLTAKRRRCT